MANYRVGKRPWAKMTQEDLVREMKKVGVIERKNENGEGYFKTEDFEKAFALYLPCVCETEKEEDDKLLIHMLKALGGRIEACGWVIEPTEKKERECFRQMLGEAGTRLRKGDVSLRNFLRTLGHNPPRSKYDPIKNAFGAPI